MSLDPIDPIDPFDIFIIILCAVAFIALAIAIGEFLLIQTMLPDC